MTAKEFLSKYRILDAEINAKLEEVAMVRSLAERVMPSNCGGVNGIVSDRVGRGAAKLADLEREIDEKIDRLVDLREEIDETIEKLERSEYRTLLRLRYITGLSARKTAEKLDISERHCKRLHKRALSEIEKILLSG